MWPVAVKGKESNRTGGHIAVRKIVVSAFTDFGARLRVQLHREFEHGYIDIRKQDM
jgi:hypothetical protein